MEMPQVAGLLLVQDLVFGYVYRQFFGCRELVTTEGDTFECVGEATHCVRCLLGTLVVDSSCSWSFKSIIICCSRCE